MLKRIIKEELERILTEGEMPNYPVDNSKMEKMPTVPGGKNAVPMPDPLNPEWLKQFQKKLGADKTLLQKFMDFIKKNGVK